MNSLNEITLDLKQDTLILAASSPDPRLRLLSYSSLLTLHLCPRKYELYKLNAEIELNESDPLRNITFAFGHVIGQGIQQVLEGKDWNTIVINAFAMWHADLFEEDTRAKKSLFYALGAIQRLHTMREHGFLADWEIATTQEGLPATELEFAIELPDGFLYRGSVDAVLVNKLTNEVMVLECKTTKYRDVNPSTYKNSAQAIGYSIVLDVLYPTLSSYEVMYLVYSSSLIDYIPPFKFNKTYMQRALWIQELLLDIEVIKLYENSLFPMHGENCVAFGRECEYINTCTLSNSRITAPYTQELADKIAKDNSKYKIRVSLQDLIEAQVSKIG